MRGPAPAARASRRLCARLSRAREAHSPQTSIPEHPCGGCAVRRGGRSVADGLLGPPGSPERLGLLAPRRGSRSQTNAARSRDRQRFAGECRGGSPPAKGKKKSRGKPRGKKQKKPEVDILSPAAMLNLYYIAHNVADCLQLRGFRWPGAAKAKKGKGKT
uniref:Uncharacterized protein n=1 Tax=Ovis aries TaxID=9940 RepID=A0AC11EH12_SHEEP